MSKSDNTKRLAKMIFLKFKKIQFMFWLKALERVVIIIAAFAAVFPLYQFYSEADDRRLDRASNFILAHAACIDLIRDGMKTQSLDTMDFLNTLPPLERLTVLAQNLAGDNISRECDYIRKANRPNLRLVSQIIRNEE